MSHFDCYYLNNSGSRYVYRDENNKSSRLNVFDRDTKKTKSYAVSYWEMIGSFAVPYVKIKGKRVQLMDYKDGMWMENNKENRDLKYGFHLGGRSFYPAA